ncbi:MAG TPA: hypothetical protein VFN53_12065 [Acidobacteriaceae bacterium]|nr:hypothetical protein [Acidobacteriaceae bacterium]
MRSLSFAVRLASFALAIAVVPPVQQAHASERHPRKYKAPPPTAHVEVTVLKASNGKPLYNAAVIFHPMKQDKDEGNMELKTNEEGKAVLDMLPIGSEVLVQVIKPGYRTFGQEYSVPSDKKAITIKLLPPDQQYSVYKQKASNSDGQNNAPQPQMGHAAPTDSPLLAPAQKKKSHPY